MTPSLGKYSSTVNHINWHVVFWGMALQFLFGIFVIKTTLGKNVITYLSVRFLELTNHAESGASFAMPKVLFFCTILSALNYFGVMQFIIKTIGGFLSFCLGSAPIESVAAAANIFLNTTETAVIVKDYLADMPLAELFCVLTTGMSSVAGVSIVIFIGFGVPAEYLLAANLMSAPAALAVAKISMPGTEENEKPQEIDLSKIKKARNLLDAVSQGCETGTRLVVAVVVNVLVYTSLLSLVNSTLEWFGDRAGVVNLSLRQNPHLICSYILWPVAYIMGVASQDCHAVASLLGIRAVTNPGIAYIEFSKYLHNKDSVNEYQLLYNDTLTVQNDLFLPQWNKTLTNGILQDKTEVIATYALCGFSCIQVVGISLGAIGALAPTRKFDLMNLAVRAFFTSTMASLLTACVAGLLYLG
ncbi:hypothetical protein KUTeg_021002 [Tegillarca granosa]|uniref:Concentrative nucleoside transporter C-terminal domain-containing protein n=1 Tax=Tegillarca granosa TaxID=220873 RepID=A0ABQ9EA25_TEGGR|nr:hypothetical protein KUTeg_021002 [Tegillarca granosa]